MLIRPSTKICLISACISVARVVRCFWPDNIFGLKRSILYLFSLAIRLLLVVLWCTQQFFSSFCQCIAVEFVKLSLIHFCGTPRPYNYKCGLTKIQNTDDQNRCLKSTSLLPETVRNCFIQLSEIYLVSNIAPSTTLYLLKVWQP